MREIAVRAISFQISRSQNIQVHSNFLNFTHKVISHVITEFFLTAMCGKLGGVILMQKLIHNLEQRFLVTFTLSDDIRVVFLLGILNEICDIITPFFVYVKMNSQT